MLNLFGDLSEEEEDEVDSEHESNPQPSFYRAVTRLSIVLLHFLLSAETSTGLIKEGSSILLKHFSCNILATFREFEKQLCKWMMRSGLLKMPH
ncbi:uncharacterized protein LOC125468295 isoform X7 [Pyrus x bretschneideri]|uniref:uncharacterized protein LOC125468295 isoform X7 n=1 Tax=Pyrus x bretschneideri TaxID=225117 RepID=UPI00202EC497|nr:uncharacterized protein LOC125468295 isoform X7 [Pyrus x bretschneideri]